VVDDERSIRITLRALLQDQGYEVAVAEDADRARELLADGGWDVVLTDIVLPGVSGVELLKSIRAASATVQVIMMTGEPSMETAAEAVRAGANDYLTKPISKSAILRSVTTATRMKRLDDERKRLLEENRAYQLNLEQLVDERTLKMQVLLQNWKEATEGTILAMAAAVESRDPYTAGHQQRVAQLAKAMARELELPADGIDAVYHAGLVHDLGKISVPAEILSHPGRLSSEAMSLVRMHSRTGHDILAKVKFPWPIARIVLEHHERLDGSGYPQALAAGQICREAHIIAVADVVEAMASHRPYRPALGIEAALDEIRKGRGVRYDSAVVDACLRLFKEKSFAFEVPSSA
jgi:putative nucleotidyltransferase with HDIG domain